MNSPGVVKYQWLVQRVFIRHRPFVDGAGKEVISCGGRGGRLPEWQKDRWRMKDEYKISDR